MNPAPYIALAVAIVALFGSLIVIACHGHDARREDEAAEDFEREERNWGRVFGPEYAAALQKDAARHRRRAARARGIRP